MVPLSKILNTFKKQTICVMSGFLFGRTIVGNENMQKPINIRIPAHKCVSATEKSVQDGYCNAI